MKAISFYTDEATERAAHSLERRLDQLQISHDFEAVPDHGSYGANRHHVPSWILWKLMEEKGPGVVWLNATASVHSMPYLLEDPDCDLALFSPAGCYWAKTLYVRNSAPARNTLHIWASLNAAHEDRISCENLKLAIEAAKPKLLLLPPTYSWLEESFPKSYGEKTAIISHPIGGL